VDEHHHGADIYFEGMVIAMIPKIYLHILIVLLLAMLSAHFYPAFAQEILSRPANSILDIAFSPTDDLVAQVSANGSVDIISLEGDKQQMTQLLPIQSSSHLWIAKLAWSTDGRYLAAGVGNTIYVWEISPPRYILRDQYVAGGTDTVVYVDPNFIPEGFISLQWDTTGSLLMARSISSRLTIRQIMTDAFIVDQDSGGNPNPIPLVWLPGNLLLSDGMSNGVFNIQSQSFEVFMRERIPVLAGSCNIVWSLDTNLDRTLLIVGTYTGCVNIVDGTTGHERAGFKIADVPIIDASFSPDESQIVAIDAEGIVRIVDATTGASRIISQNTGELYAVDWSRTNGVIAYGGISSADTAVMTTIPVESIEQMSTERDVIPALLAVTPMPGDE
jgi:WD40 repeat protein